MVVFTLQQRLEVLRQYFENHASVAECVRKLRMDFGRREKLETCEKVKETGILIDKSKREKPKTVRTLENIADVAERVREASSTLIYRRPQQLKTSVTSLSRILHRDLAITSFKVQLVQELKLIDHSASRRCRF